MDPLYELLSPYFEQPESASSRLLPPSSDNPQTINYLNRLSKLSLADLTSTEPASLVQASQSHLRSLQALSKRSHKAVIACSAHTSNLATLLPALESRSRALQDDVPELEAAASSFAQKYDRSTENAVLDRRKEALLLSRNLDRASDVLDLPALLSSTVAAAQTASAASASITSTSYASALDLHAHVKRLHTLYPRSELVANISKQAEAEMENLAGILISTLQSPTLKLAGAMRTIGWLRRVAPDLSEDGYERSRSSSKSYTTGTTKTPSRTFDPTSAASDDSSNSDGALGTLFLTCRLHTLNKTLEALEPLRDLADQETSRRKSGLHAKLLRQQVSASSLGSQSERYLKRYIEIFREQSFGIVGMYRSIFPDRLPGVGAGGDDASKRETGASVANGGDGGDALLPLPSPLATFSLHLVDLLADTLRAYLPNIVDQSARESLLTQVLYCAGSLSRLGAEFGMLIALLGEEIAETTAAPSNGGGSEGAGSADLDGNRTTSGEDAEEAEWVQVMLKHRVQASRLKVLARGVSGGGSRKSSADLLNSPVTPA